MVARYLSRSKSNSESNSNSYSNSNPHLLLFWRRRRRRLTPINNNNIEHRLERPASKVNRLQAEAANNINMAFLLWILSKRWCGIDSRHGKKGSVVCRRFLNYLFLFETKQKSRGKRDHQTRTHLYQIRCSSKSSIQLLPCIMMNDEWCNPIQSNQVEFILS